MHPEGKPYLKELAHRLGARWSNHRKPGEVFDIGGETRLESLRTIYRFSEGVCREVERRRDAAPFDARILGMRLVAWLHEHEDGPPTLHGEWRPGARGVLWRPAERDPHGRGRSATVAMTSPTFAFVPDRIRPRASGERASAAAPRPDADSVTRLHLPVALTG